MGYSEARAIERADVIPGSAAFGMVARPDISLTDSLVARAAADGEDLTTIEGYQPGRAYEISTRVFDFDREVLSNLFKTQLTVDQYREASARIVAIGEHLIEAARTSPMLDFNGSYTGVDVWYGSFGKDFLFHEVIHGAVKFEHSGYPVPSFLTAPSQLENNEILVREEFEAGVVWYFEDTIAQQMISQQTKNPSFMSCLAALEKDVTVSLAYAAGLYAEDGGMDKKEATSKMLHMCADVRQKPSANYLERARRIYDAAVQGKGGGAYREFMSMTEGVTPLSRRAP